jgi:hypothetical protein
MKVRTTKEPQVNIQQASSDNRGWHSTLEKRDSKSCGIIIFLSHFTTSDVRHLIK